MRGNYEDQPKGEAKEKWVEAKAGYLPKVSSLENPKSTCHAENRLVDSIKIFKILCKAQEKSKSGNRSVKNCAIEKKKTTKTVFRPQTHHTTFAKTNHTTLSGARRSWIALCVCDSCSWLTESQLIDAQIANFPSVFYSIKVVQHS